VVVPNRVSPPSTAPFPFTSAYSFTAEIPVASFPVPEAVIFIPVIVTGGAPEATKVETNLDNWIWRTGTPVVPGTKVFPDGGTGPEATSTQTGQKVEAG
jgi:hypothetical protein